MKVMYKKTNGDEWEKVLVVHVPEKSIPVIIPLHASKFEREKGFSKRMKKVWGV